jgi:hypothetical protein
MVSIGEWQLAFREALKNHIFEKTSFRGAKISVTLNSTEK